MNGSDLHSFLLLSLYDVISTPKFEKCSKGYSCIPPLLTSMRAIFTTSSVINLIGNRQIGNHTNRTPQTSFQEISHVELGSKPVCNYSYSVDELIVINANIYIYHFLSIELFNFLKD